MLAGDHPLVISSRKRGIKQRPERQRGREVSFAECGFRILSRPGARLSKSLVEMHGGTIEAHSEGLGKGATFRVKLPLLPKPTGYLAPSRRPPELNSPSHHRILHVLVVEDHGDTAEMMRFILESEGHHVDTAGDVQTALDKVAQEHFDMLISDLGLPDGSGLDVMRELRARGCSLPGIALSGYGQDTDIQLSRQAGFAIHITKPVDMDRLLAAIETAIPRQS